MAIISRKNWNYVSEVLPIELKRYQVAVKYRDDGSTIVTEALYSGDGWCDQTCDELLGGKVDVYAWKELPHCPQLTKPIKSQWLWKVKRGDRTDKRHHYKWHIMKALGDGYWLLAESDSSFLRAWFRVFSHYWKSLHYDATGQVQESLHHTRQEYAAQFDGASQRAFDAKK